MTVSLPRFVVLAIDKETGCPRLLIGTDSKELAEQKCDLAIQLGCWESVYIQDQVETARIMALLKGREGDKDKTDK